MKYLIATLIMAAGVYIGGMGIIYTMKLIGEHYDKAHPRSDDVHYD